MASNSSDGSSPQETAPSVSSTGVKSQNVKASPQRPLSWNDSISGVFRRFSPSSKTKRPTKLDEPPQSAVTPKQSDQGSSQSPGHSSHSRTSRHSLTSGPAPQTVVTPAQTQKGLSLQQFPGTPQLSADSSGYVPDSGFAQFDFILGAGMVIFEENTFKVVVVHDEKTGHWFFPKGRKDIGESLEQAALREAYEESGYVTQFFPLYNRSRQPGPPEDALAEWRRNTEAVYITIRAWVKKDPVEYLTHWYVGLIPENATRHTGTGMPDEAQYKSHLLAPEEAMKRLRKAEAKVLRYVCQIVENDRRQGQQLDHDLKRAEEMWRAQAQTEARLVSSSEVQQPQDTLSGA